MSPQGWNSESLENFFLIAREVINSKTYKSTYLTKFETTFEKEKKSLNLGTVVLFCYQLELILMKLCRCRKTKSWSKDINYDFKHISFVVGRLSCSSLKHSITKLLRKFEGCWGYHLLLLAKCQNLRDVWTIPQLNVGGRVEIFHKTRKNKYLLLLLLSGTNDLKWSSKGGIADCWKWQGVFFNPKASKL